jgi:hypothetical protein
LDFDIGDKMQHIIYLEKADVFRVAKNQEGESEKETRRKERKEEGYSPHIKRLVERSRERREAEEPVEKSRKFLDFGTEDLEKGRGRDKKQRRRRSGGWTPEHHDKYKATGKHNYEKARQEGKSHAEAMEVVEKENKRWEIYKPLTKPTGFGEGMGYIRKSGADKFLEFLDKNPNPPDKKIHALADKLGIEHDKLEAMIYSILSDVIEHGKGGPEPDQKELDAGVKVEAEHTKYPELAEYIARAHLKEIPDYYTRLKVMEDQAKAKKENK